MWASLLRGIFESLLNFGWGVFKEERARTAEINEKALKGQLASTKEGVETQLRWQKDQEKPKKPVSSGADWNKVNPLPILFLSGMLLSGCYRYVYVESYRPVPPKIVRPTLDDASPFNAREQVLSDYALKLETAYEAVRKDAIDHNLKNGLSVGVSE
jgi:hypothetical protein